jgi:hypothetical protein
MIPILQRLIDATTIPLWIIAITMLALAVRACWHNFTR